MFELVSRPIHKDFLEHSTYPYESGDAKLPIILYPSPQSRIEDPGNIIQRFLGFRMQPPASNLILERLFRLAAYGRGESDEVLSVLATHQPRFERIAEKIELPVLILCSTIGVLAIHDSGLLLIDRKSAFRQTFFNPAL